jgi:hypothetical protein
MDLKYLSKVADLCRKKGVAEFKYTDSSGHTYELKLWDVIPKATRKRAPKAESLEAKLDSIPVEGSITDEQMLFYSAPDLGGGMA